jgi:hypothetical protein
MYMSFKMVKLLLIFQLMLYNIASSQESINSGGATLKSPGGSVSYSVGQLSTNFLQNQSGTVSEGVHQPYEIFLVSGKEYTFIEVSIMPNPVSDILRIKLQNYPFSAIQYKIFDQFGKLLIVKESDSENTEIQMGGLPSSWYILEISEHKKVLKTYKIIKY